jgi:hypothetical protein
MTTYAIICPKLFFVKFDKVTGVVAHITAASYDAKRGKGAAQRFLSDPAAGLRKFGCLTFSESRPTGPSGSIFYVSGYGVCSLMMSAAMDNPELKSGAKEFAALFEYTMCQNAAVTWFDEVGRHLIFGTLPPSDRPDLTGKLRSIMGPAEFAGLQLRAKRRAS